MKSDDPQSVAPIFEPVRLVLARQARGLKKKDLAALVDVTPAAITQYEHGASRPTPTILAKLALSTGFPVGWFAQGRPSIKPDATGAHFRSLRATTQAERSRAFAHATLGWELCQAIERRVRLPVLDLPIRDVGPDASLESIERIAEFVRGAWDVPRGPVGNMLRLLESRGIFVMRLDGHTERVDAFSYCFPDRPVVVLSDRKNDRARSRFDAAHELGHLVMHHDADPGGQLVERQAHQFAAAFLMPSADIRSQLPMRADWTRLLALKQQWGVSIASLLYRARTLGVMTEASYRRAVTYMSKRAWRRDEPGDLGPAEEPCLVKKSLELVAGQSFAEEHLAAELCAPLDLVRAIGSLVESRPTVEIEIAPTAASDASGRLPRLRST